MSAEPSPDKQILKEIQDYIASLPQDQQHFVSSRVQALRMQLQDPKDVHGLGRLAIALVGAELAAED